MKNMKVTCQNVEVSIGNPVYNDGNEFLKVSLVNYNLENLLIVLCEDYGRDVIIEKLNEIQ